MVYIIVILYNIYSNIILYNINDIYIILYNIYDIYILIYTIQITVITKSIKS